MRKINKNLSFLLTGQLISQIGDKFYSLALSFWILNTTKSASLMGIVLFFSLAPSIIIGFISGGFIDNLNRRKILIITDILRGMIISLVVLSYFLNVMNIYIIIVAQILLSICAAFFNPTVNTVIIQVVEKDELSRANSKSQLINGVSTIIGPVLGGICVAYLGYTFVFIFNAASFYIAALFSGLIYLPFSKIQNVTSKKIAQDIVEGYKYIIKKKNLIVLLLMTAVVHLFVGSIQVLIPVVATRLQGNGAQNLGLIEMFFGIGVLLSSLILSVFSINNREQKLMFACITTLGFIVLIFGLIVGVGLQSLILFSILFMLISSVIIGTSTCYQVLIQKNVINDMAGRVFGVVSSIGNLSIPVATILYGFLLQYLNISYVVSTTGAVIIVLAILFCKIYKKQD